MELNLEQIRAVTQGAVTVTQENGAFHFYRFAPAQLAAYEAYDRELSKKTLTTAGVRLVFRTDSRKLKLAVGARIITRRRYFRLEVFADECYLGCIQNCENATCVDDPAFSDGDFSGQFCLGEGEKTVRIQLPWSVALSIYNLTLDDGAKVIPVRPEKKILMLGDSITQGYDAMSPSGAYSVQVARMLDLELFNNAVGGDVFYPPVIRDRLPFTPDYITVAFGTNDYAKNDNRITEENCRTYYKILREHYPRAKMFAMAPVRRLNIPNARREADFSEIAGFIEKTANALEGVTFINCLEFVPADEKLFSDKYLHPNDEGFRYYIKNLYPILKSHI